MDLNCQMLLLLACKVLLTDTVYELSRQPSSLSQDTVVFTKSKECGCTFLNPLSKVRLTGSGVHS